MKVYFDSSALANIHVTEPFSDPARREAQPTPQLPFTWLPALEASNALQVLADESSSPWSSPANCWNRWKTTTKPGVSSMRHWTGRRFFMRLCTSPDGIRRACSAAV